TPPRSEGCLIWDAALKSSPHHSDRELTMGRRRGIVARFGTRGAGTPVPDVTAASMPPTSIRECPHCGAAMPGNEMRVPTVPYHLPRTDAPARWESPAVG